MSAKNMFPPLNFWKDVIDMVIKMSREQIDGKSRRFLLELKAKCFTQKEAYEVFQKISKDEEGCSSFVRALFDVSKYYMEPIE